MRKPKLTRAEDDLLELLASLVAQYEQTRFPAPDVTPAAKKCRLTCSKRFRGRNPAAMLDC
jgi:hypothetical protein